MQAVVRSRRETTPFFVTPPRTRIESLDAVSDRPFNWGVVASVKMQTVYILLTAPVASLEAIALGEAERHAHRLAEALFTIGRNKDDTMTIVGL